MPKRSESRIAKGRVPIAKISRSTPPTPVDGVSFQCGHYSDIELNKLYNSSKFVLLPSKAEGIGLPMIESMICGALPITCSDNETAKEFLPRDFICAPDPKSILEHIKKLENEYANKRNLAFEFGKRYKEKFNKSSIAKNILNILKYSGYIYGFENIDSKTMKVFLKYNNNKPAISKINQLSSSKKKVYIHIKDLNPHNLNLYILSTSMGIISHYDAIKFNVGGELLLQID